MKYNKDLLKIIEGKVFKSFWHCLDYLLIAGFSPMDAFGVSLKQYGESKIFSNVSFIRVETKWLTNESQLLVGIIDETNIHLDGMYAIYRKKINENKNLSPISEIEETCEIIRISHLSNFLLEYLLEVTAKHFGEKLFIIPTYNTLPRGLPIIEDFDDYHRGLDGEVLPNLHTIFGEYLRSIQNENGKEFDDDNR